MFTKHQLAFYKIPEANLEIVSVSKEQMVEPVWTLPYLHKREIRIRQVTATVIGST